MWVEPRGFFFKMQWPFLRSKAGLAPTSERHAPKQAHTSYRKRVASKDQLQQNTLCEKPLSAEEVEANLAEEEAELEGDDCRETVDLLAESPSRVSHSLRQGLGFRV